MIHLYTLGTYLHYYRQQQRNVKSEKVHNKKAATTTKRQRILSSMSTLSSMCGNYSAEAKMNK